MTNIDKNEISEPEIITGQYGAVKTDTEVLPKTAYIDKPVIDKKIQRFSYNGDLVAEITSITSLDGTIEIIYLEPKYMIDGLKWDITLGLEKRQDKYIFSGNAGFAGIGYVEIPKNTFTKALNKVTEICNPDFDYGDEFHSFVIDDIIDLMRELNNEKVNQRFLKYWDMQIYDPQESFRLSKSINSSNKI